MSEVIAALGLILSVLLAYLKIQKNQRAGLPAPRSASAQRAQLKLYERVSTVLAEAGGWSPKSASVLTECYQFAENDTMLAVMSEPRKVSDRATGM
jgi:hypothetical protein